MSGQELHGNIFEFTQAAGWTCIGGYVFVTDKGVLVEMRPFGGKWHIALIVTPRENRKQGLARHALKVLLGAADKHQITVCLNAVPTRGSSMRQPQLIRWYTRYGFFKDQTTPLMTRPPKSCEKTNQHATKP